tara:strand:+ start:1775 stop:2707 length:933 start_codon:yes stop_codon:yes gene_type:complete
VYKEKLTILKDILGESYRSGGEQLFFCPKCNHHKKKMSVNIDKDKFKCWVCDYHGSSVRRLVRRYGNYSHQKKWAHFEPDIEISRFEEVFFGGEDEEEVITLSLPSEFKSLATVATSLAAKPARRYLMERGITREDILRWKIGYCPSGEYAGRIVIPSFNCDGKVSYFVGRTYDGNWKKYMNPSVKRNIVFNELYVDWQSDLSIVEGVFDAIVAGNAVPILGSSLREDSRLIKNVVENDTPVYIALDPDAEKKALKLIKKLLTFDIELYKVDINPYTDVGEMSKEEYQKRKDSAALMTNDSFLVKAIASI